jgi:hypothetical protein
MPVKVGDFAQMDPKTFEELRYNQPSTTHAYNPNMLKLLELVAEGIPVQVNLLPGQSHRTVRSAISNSARARGLKTETLAGDGYVAVRTLVRIRRKRSQNEPSRTPANYPNESRRV